MEVDDDALVDAASRLARDVESGVPVPPSIESLLRAAALTRQQARRTELARQAAERAGRIGQNALIFLRVALFALAAP